MDKKHSILKIDFSGEWMILSVDEQTYQIQIAQVSQRLAQASDIERKMYRISPSGYGIHWYAIDEDLTAKGLIQLAKTAKIA
jgi:sulfur transfer complex TusBCD TusB component (DsrH family)